MSEETDWLFTEEAQVFLQANLDKKPESFLLSKALANKGWDTKIIARQLKGLKVAQSKFPTWFQTKGILYPAAVSLEQSSSELTARYKASLIVKGASADLSGGMGIDAYFLSLVSTSFVYVEPSEELNKITQHNFRALGAKNIQSVCATALDFLQTNTALFSCLYLDPSRRKEGQRMSALSDWEPDVVGLKPLFWKYTKQVLVKMSPMVDLSEVCKELGEVKEVHVVSSKNECKEVLLLVEKGWSAPCRIIAVALKEMSKDSYAFTTEEEQSAEPQYSQALQYLYEPDVALLKAGAFKKIAVDFNLKKIHQHTHLYTSNTLSTSFMGRTFKIEEVLPCTKKNITTLVAKQKDFHVLTRNAVLTADQVKSQWKLVERGELYLILFKGLDGTQYIAKANRL